MTKEQATLIMQTIEEGFVFLAKCQHQFSLVPFSDRCSDFHDKVQDIINDLPEDTLYNKLEACIDSDTNSLNVENS